MIGTHGRVLKALRRECTNDKEVDRVIGLVITLGTLLLQIPQAQAFENPPIRVRLEASVSQVSFEGVGVQIHGREKAFEPVAIPKKQTIQIRRESLQGKPVWKVVRSGSTEIVAQPFLALKAIELRSGGKLLPNQIFLSANKNKFDVVGILPLEDYLVGVIASEMPLSWPLETLKAQAIAARSYALGTMKERSKQAFHVESTILDQVFSHIGNGPDESPLIAKAKEAVRATSGMILMTGENPRVLKAFYHSDCGGRTTDAKTVWGVGPSTGSAIDSSCPSNPRAQWNLQVEEITLTEKLKAFLKKPILGGLESLNLIRATTKDRVHQIALFWDTGEQTKISAQDFRSALGYDQLRSTMFEMKKTKNGYQFQGLGFGHGVGLCQWGARQLGQQGRRFEEILTHYYPKARLLNSEQALQARTEQKLETQTR